MDYIKEAREVTQSYYGGYCELCRKMDVTPMPYHKFRVQEYYDTKKVAKNM